jgi:hypothetical protein
MRAMPAISGALIKRWGFDAQEKTENVYGGGVEIGLIRATL